MAFVYTAAAVFQPDRKTRREIAQSIKDAVGKDIPTQVGRFRSLTDYVLGRDYLKGPAFYTVLSIAFLLPVALLIIFFVSGGVANLIGQYRSQAHAQDYISLVVWFGVLSVVPGFLSFFQTRLSITALERMPASNSPVITILDVLFTHVIFWLTYLALHTYSGTELLHSTMPSADFFAFTSQVLGVSESAVPVGSALVLAAYLPSYILTIMLWYFVLTAEVVEEQAQTLKKLTIRGRIISEFLPESWLNYRVNPVMFVAHSLNLVITTGFILWGIGTIGYGLFA